MNVVATELGLVWQASCDSLGWKPAVRVCTVHEAWQYHRGVLSLNITSARRSWHPGRTAFDVEMFEKAVVSTVEAVDDDMNPTG